jgi:hypothetical protein
MNDSVLEIPVKTIDGRPTTLDQYRGRVLLIVNVASKCGLTPQYTQLESLYQAKRAAGLEILGFPGQRLHGAGTGKRYRDRDLLLHPVRRAFPVVQQDQREGPGPTPAVRRTHACASRGAGRGTHAKASRRAWYPAGRAGGGPVEFREISGEPRRLGCGRFAPMWLRTIPDFWPRSIASSRKPPERRFALRSRVARSSSSSASPRRRG